MNRRTGGVVIEKAAAKAEPGSFPTPVDRIDWKRSKVFVGGKPMTLWMRFKNLFRK